MYSDTPELMVATRVPSTSSGVVPAVPSTSSDGLRTWRSYTPRLARHVAGGGIAVVWGGGTLDSRRHGVLSGSNVLVGRTLRFCCRVVHSKWRFTANNAAYVSASALLSVVSYFRQPGSALESNSPGRPRTAIGRASVTAVRASYQLSPLQALGIILRRYVEIHPYKIVIANMCRDFLRNILLTGVVLFTDEANFHLSVTVNKQNIRYWSQDNLRELYQGPPRGNGVVRHWSMCPVVFEEYDVITTVSSDRYCALLDRFLRPKSGDIFTEHGRENARFQKDGAQAHTSRLSLGILREMFPGPDVSKRAANAVTGFDPMRLFMWGYLTSEVYQRHPHTHTHTRLTESGNYSRSRCHSTRHYPQGDGKLQRKSQYNIDYPQTPTETSFQRKLFGKTGTNERYDDGIKRIGDDNERYDDGAVSWFRPEQCVSDIRLEISRPGDFRPRNRHETILASSQESTFRREETRRPSALSFWRKSLAFVPNGATEWSLNYVSIESSAFSRSTHTARCGGKNLSARAHIYTNLLRPLPRYPRGTIISLTRRSLGLRVRTSDRFNDATTLLRATRAKCNSSRESFNHVISCESVHGLGLLTQLAGVGVQPLTLAAAGVPTPRGSREQSRSHSSAHREPNSEPSQPGAMEFAILRDNTSGPGQLFGSHEQPFHASTDEEAEFRLIDGVVCTLPTELRIRAFYSP
ncbi:hypothetical protein PR048_016391, partial [Dryococelus australis]